MKSVLVYSNELKKGQKIVENIKKRPHLKTKLFEDLDDLRDMELLADSHLLVLYISQGLDQSWIVEHKIDELSQFIQVLICSEKLSNMEVYRYVSYNSRMRALETDVDEERFYQLVNKILKDGAVKQQMHRRYLTNEQAEMMAFGQENKIKGKLKNLSLGGAFIALPLASTLRLDAGDMIKVQVPLKHEGKTHVINGEIMWLHKDEKNKIQGVGIHFLSKEECYEKMMSKISA